MKKFIVFTSKDSLKNIENELKKLGINIENICFISDLKIFEEELKKILPTIILINRDLDTDLVKKILDTTYIFINTSYIGFKTNIFLFNDRPEKMRLPGAGTLRNLKEISCFKIFKELKKK